MAVKALLFGALLLGLFNLASDVNTITEIEGDQRSLRAAREMLEDAREQARRDLRSAGDDPIDKARAELVLKRLETIERRLNPTAMMRQVQQSKESFQDKEWGEAVGGGAIWIAEGVGADATALKALWEVLSLPQDGSRTVTGAEILERIRVLTGALERFGPLPPEIGDYLTWTTLMDTLRANPQIASLPGSEQAAFLCDQTQKRLNQLLRDESDNNRSAILQLARENLTRHCQTPDNAPSSEPDAVPVDCDAYAKSVASQEGQDWMYESAYNMCVNGVLQDIIP